LRLSAESRYVLGVPDHSSKVFAPGRLSALPNACARVKGFAFIFAALFSSLIAAQADLIVRQLSGDSTITNYITLMVHDAKMRMDQRDTDGYSFNVIIDLNTRDSITLFQPGNTFLKRSGAEIRQQMEAEKKASNGTNDMDKAPAPAVNTGQIENVHGYDANIYTWSGANGLTERLWVAKDFPNYDTIRTELAKIDRFESSGPHKNAQPELSLLPGMVIKTETTANGKTITVNLISARLQPADESLFKLPAGYSPWESPVLSMTNAPTMPGK
jgi:hypothetical protein